MLSEDQTELPEHAQSVEVAPLAEQHLGETLAIEKGEGTLLAELPQWLIDILAWPVDNLLNIVLTLLAVMSVAAYFYKKIKEKRIKDNIKRSKDPKLPSELAGCFTCIDDKYIEKNKKIGGEEKEIIKVSDMALVASGKAITRDLEEPVLNALRQKTQREGIELLIINGEQGSGKTTFLMQLAKKLVEEDKETVYLYKLSERSDVRGDLEKIKQLPVRGKKPYILISNIFNCAEISDILQELEANFIILADSPTHKVADIDSVQMIQVDKVEKDLNGLPILGGLSVQELANLRQKYPSIKANVWEKIITPGKKKIPVWKTATAENHAPIIVVVSKLFAIIENPAQTEEILKESPEKIIYKVFFKHIDGLKRDDETAFYAYCAICAFYRIGLAVPSSILEILLNEYVRPLAAKTFMSKLKTDAKNGSNDSHTRGLIIPGSISAGEYNWVAGHELYARALAADFSEYKKDVQSFSDEKFITRLDGKNPQHRLFAALFFIKALHVPVMKEKAKGYIMGNNDFKKFISADNRHNARWAFAYLRAGDREKAIELVKADEPSEYLDIMYTMRLADKFWFPSFILEKAYHWAKNHKDTNTHFWSIYLSLASKTNIPGEKAKEALHLAREWQESNPSDSAFWTAYMALARRSPKEEVKETLRLAREWQEKNYSESNIHFWTAYMTLARRSPKEEVKEALRLARGWQEKNPLSSAFWSAYMILAGKISKEEGKEALRLAREWQESNPSGSAFWSAYMTLARRSPKEEVKEAEALHLARGWQEKNSSESNTHFWTAYMTLAGIMPKEEGKGALCLAREWQESNPSDSEFWSAYMTLAGKISKEEAKEALRLAKGWQEKNPSNAFFWSAYMTLARHTEDTAIQTEVLCAAEIWWRDNNRCDSYFWSAYLRLIIKVGTQEQIEDALTETKKWLEKNHKDNGRGLIINLHHELSRAR